MLFLFKILRLFIIIEKIQYIKLRNREKNWLGALKYLIILKDKIIIIF
jgi:hypothetical protein